MSQLSALTNAFNPSRLSALVILMWRTHKYMLHMCLPPSALQISLISVMLHLSAHESSNYPSPRTLIMPLAGPTWSSVCVTKHVLCVSVFHMELKVFTADSSSLGTRGKLCLHFYMAVLYLQRNGKSITGAEGEWRRMTDEGGGL